MTFNQLLILYIKEIQDKIVKDCEMIMVCVITVVVYFSVLPDE